VALLSNGNQIDGYLNVTPKQGTETLANWSRFRPRHSRGEGDRGVRLIATTAEGHFRSERGACVIDDYATSKATYMTAPRLQHGSGRRYARTLHVRARARRPE
jgi:hypothetical protein